MSKKQNVCEMLLEMLKEVGVEHIFGVTGDALNPLLEAMREDGAIKWYGVRHEENAAYAAYADSIIHGGIGVCAGTVGPGALHLINGLYNAKREGAGVVAITGQVAHKELGTEYHQEVDLVKMFADICDYQAVIHSPEQMPRLAQIAIQKALLERKVVRIELPIDVSEKEVPSLHFRHPPLQKKSQLLPHKDEIARAAQFINESHNVTLFCGAGSREARSEVLQLSEKINAPVAHTLKAKDIFDYSDGNVVGMTGLIGNPAGYHSVLDADTLIMVGTDFPYDWFLPEGCHIIQIESSLNRLGRRAKTDTNLHGDSAVTLQQLLPLIKSKEDNSFLKKHLQLRDKWLAEMEQQSLAKHSSNVLHPQFVARTASDCASSDAVFATDVGECTVWMARQVSLKNERRLVGSFNHGSLGSGLPSALGAVAKDPSRQVWALCGDGGFGMAMQDFVTAIRYNWPLNVIVFNNGVLGFVKMEMEISGYPVNPSATDLTNPNFAEYANSCGGVGIRVTTPEEVTAAIAEATKNGKPTLIEAMVSPGELVMPPHIAAQQAWGFGISKLKEGVLGLKGEHEQWENWKSEIKGFL